jgi:ribulose-phosphate 3-epimerase
MVNVMTVEPGFGGQRFIASSPDKIRRVCELAPGLDVEVDGGIDSESAPLVVAAGARLLVAGSSVFSYPEGVAAGIRALRESVV